MDWKAFEDWALADLGRAPATVYYNVGRLRSLVRQGLDVDLFLSSPQAMADERRRLKAGFKREGRSGHAIRTHQKALNWLVQYAEHLQPALKWDLDELEKEPASTRPSVAPSSLVKLWECRADDTHDMLTARAISWIAGHLRFRRGEIHRMTLADLDARLSRVRKRRPSKSGVPGWIPAPTFFWADDAPMAVYLKRRFAIDGGWLWTRINGLTGKVHRVSYAGVYDLVRHAGRRHGLELNLLATRRGGASWLDDEYAIHPRVGQFLLSQNQQKSYEHYVRGVSIQRAVRELAERGVPGYADHPILNAAPETLHETASESRNLIGAPGFAALSPASQDLSDPSRAAVSAAARGLLPVIGDDTVNTPTQKAWRPTAAVSAAAVGLPAPEQNHSKRGDEKSAPNGFTRTRAVAPTGARRVGVVSVTSPSRPATRAEVLLAAWRP